MKHHYLLLSGLIFSIYAFGQSQHLERADFQGACTVIANPQNITCFGSCDGNATAIANGVPPFDYQWSNGASGSTVSGLCVGNYTVIMTDSTGCIDTADVSITQPTALSSTILSSYLNCQCTFIPIVTGGVFPYSYLWCNSSTAPILNDCTPGLCTVIITDANGCMLQDTVMITPAPPLTLTPAVTDATCNGCSDGSIAANLTGGAPPITYALLQTGSTNSTGIFSGLAAGSYTLCATDSNFCSVCTTLTVNEPPVACSVTITVVNNILCYGDCNGTLTAVGNGVPPFSYTWSNGDNTATADSLCAGTHAVVMIDSVGCIDTTVATLNEPPPIITSFTSDFSNCNCTYTIIANGGTPPFTYAWCDGSIGQSFSNCTPGLCIVIITDANGCSMTDSLILNPPPPLSLTVQTTGTSCTGCADGYLTSVTAGGFPPYSYLLTPGNNLCDTCLNLTAGVYTLCVTDSSNCTVCVSDTVEDDPTSLSGPDSKKALKISPNPFRNYLQVDISDDLIVGHANFILSDVTGRILVNVQLKQEHSKLFLEDISPGIYFYQLFLDNKKEFKGRLIATD